MASLLSIVLVFCILSLSIVNATWIKIDRFPSDSDSCDWMPDSSTLLKSGTCLHFDYNYAITVSVYDDGIVVGNCTDSACGKCTYTTYEEDACDTENGIKVSTYPSLPFTQYYGYTTVFYTGAKCSDTPVGAFIDNHNYSTSCSLPSGTPCNNFFNTKEFCTIPEDLFVTPKGPNFSQKFNPDASFIVASGYPSNDCGGKETVQLVQQLENCMVASGSSAFFKVENGNIFLYNCDDTVCGTCTSMQMPQKQCMSKDMLGKKRSTEVNIFASVFQPVTDRRQKRDTDSDSEFDGLFDDVESGQFEVVKGFPKKYAKNKGILVEYAGDTLECKGDINMMMFHSQCLTLCFLGIESTCNIDALLDKIAPGWGKSGVSAGVIVAIVITVIVVVGVVVGIVLYKRHKRGDRGRSYFNQAEQSDAFPNQG